MEHSVSIVDASVLMAAMQGEISPEQGEHWLQGASISAVNLSEVVAKFAKRGLPSSRVERWVSGFQLDIWPFDAAMAYRAGNLRPLTRTMGLSFADRACLALAQQLDRPVVTADRAWAALDLGIPVEVIR